MDLHLMSLNARAAFRKVYVASAETRNHALGSLTPENPQSL